MIWIQLKSFHYIYSFFYCAHFYVFFYFSCIFCYFFVYYYHCTHLNVTNMYYLNKLLTIAILILTLIVHYSHHHNHADDHVYYAVYHHVCLCVYDHVYFLSNHNYHHHFVVSNHICGKCLNMLQNQIGHCDNCYPSCLYCDCLLGAGFLTLEKIQNYSGDCHRLFDHNFGHLFSY